MISRKDFLDIVREYRFLMGFADNDCQCVIKRYYFFAADLLARIERDVEWASSFFELFQYVFAMHRMSPRQAYRYQNRIYTCHVEFSLYLS